MTVRLSRKEMGQRFDERQAKIEALYVERGEKYFAELKAGTETVSEPAEFYARLFGDLFGAMLDVIFEE